MKQLGWVVALFVGGCIAAACGDDDGVQATQPTPTFVSGSPCGALRSECVSEQQGRTCPGDPGSSWVYFPCAADQRCSDGECVVDNAPCTVGTTRCRVLSAVEACLIQVEDPEWVVYPCRPGQHCHEGVCLAIELEPDAALGDAG